MKKPALASLALTAALAAAAVRAPAAPTRAASPKTTPASPPASGPNPLLTRSTLPFQAPPFDRIHDADYGPAIEQGMKEQLAEIAAIADAPAAPTFANTIEAMERSGELLTRAYKVFSNVEQSNTNDALQKTKADVAPKLAAQRDAIYLDPKLFERVRSLYDRRDSLALDAESKRLLERVYRDFVRAGARLSDADKAALTELNREESTLTTRFDERLLADTNASGIAIADRRELSGLSDEDVAAAAQAASERKLDGKWVLALQNTTQQPALAFLTNRGLRQRLLAASMRRGSHGGDNDTRDVVSRLAELRAKKAKLLGYATYADYALENEMAKNPQNAEKLMDDLVPGATNKARGEAARMQEIVDAEKGGFKLGAADWELYAEKLRKAEYDLDQSQVRPYFELDRVLKDGVFYAANKMYGVTFKERKDIPVYHPDVRVWEVFDADGSSLALFYGDYFLRPSKAGGAWCDSFVDQSGLLGTKAAILNNLNLTKPAPGQPALISFEDATVVFHEFGHALHGMFQRVKYPTLANTPPDWGEFPSQFNEHWALEPSVFASYAKHWKTGEPMPAALVEKIKKSRTFNQGYLTTEYLAAALLDMAWHTLPADAPKQDVDAFEKAALEKRKVDLAQVPPRYRTTYFGHIWGGGYAAGYYAYLWSEVLAHDAYYWFRENGGMTRENGQRYRDMILSRGASQDVAELYRAFRGRDPEVQPLLQERGLAATTAAPAR
ncbi:MAG TPA: M3 family metallopeptidase [Thermoanaerobaculia bacterium]|nr:M3 family metallopeptidase [Thermoanaerobaculia bacterium]